MESARIAPIGDLSQRLGIARKEPVVVCRLILDVKSKAKQSQGHVRRDLGAKSGVDMNLPRKF